MCHLVVVHILDHAPDGVAVVEVLYVHRLIDDVLPGQVREQAHASSVLTEDTVGADNLARPSLEQSDFAHHYYYADCFSYF